MRLRPFSPGDRDRVEALLDEFQDVFVPIDPLKRTRRLEGYGPAALRSTLETVGTDGLFLIAEVEGDIAGFVAVTISATSEEQELEVVPGTWGRITELFVREPFRGRGIGTALMARAETFCRDRGCTTRVEVFAPNGAAHRFYRELGYADRDVDLIKLLRPDVGGSPRGAVPSGVSAADVCEVVAVFEAAGVDHWIDGGWGVDALLGEQTRRHGDLDVALRREHVPAIRAALKRIGFRHDPDIRPGLPARVVLIDDRGRQVDLHPLVIDAAGDGWQPLGGGAWAGYPADGRRGSGEIAGTPVACLTAQLQLHHHLGYPWDDQDRADMRAPASRFALSLPPDDAQRSA